MRTTLLLASLGLALGCGADDDAAGAARSAQSTEPRAPAQISEADHARLVASVNDTGFSLFRALPTQGGNALFAPTSIGVALGMAYAGARGDTATEMARALGYGDGAVVHAAFNRLTADLAARNVAPRTTPEGVRTVDLQVLQSSWLQDDYAFEPRFLDTLAAQYGAGIFLVDFLRDPMGSASVVNRWVSEHTDGRIRDLLSPGDLTRDTRFVLVNTTLMKASWAQPFHTDVTTPAPFEAPGGPVTAAMMRQGFDALAHAATPEYAAIELPYEGRALSMLVVLPAPGQLEATRKALSSAWLAALDARLAATGIDLALPRFSFETPQMHLREGLEALGMKKAFVLGSADFTGVASAGETLFLSDVVQKAFIEVRENGTEAGAASAVVGAAGSSLPPPHQPFIVDRPFLFLIRDVSGAVLFVGQVLDPTSMR